MLRENNSLCWKATLCQFFTQSILFRIWYVKSLESPRITLFNFSKKRCSWNNFSLQNVGFVRQLISKIIRQTVELYLSEIQLYMIIVCILYTPIDISIMYLSTYQLCVSKNILSFISKHCLNYLTINPIADHARHSFIWIKRTLLFVNKN